MRFFAKLLIVWMTLFAVPLQGFAAATMAFCVPLADSVATQQNHLHDSMDHESMADDMAASDTDMHEQTAVATTSPNHQDATHHHASKCATCATCGSCIAMAPSFLSIPPVPASVSITVPFEQQWLPSVHLALPERPPRA